MEKHVLKDYRDTRYLGVSEKYKHVYKIKDLDSNTIVYRANIKTLNWCNYYTTEKEAGKQVDIKLIEKGLEPVNVLKRKIQ